ncbi:13212_t:CDS:2, partial [Acaulospora morrowiae]
QSRLKVMAGLDQEALQELQQNQSQNPIEMPDFSSTIANYLTKGSNDKPPSKKN